MQVFFSKVFFREMAVFHLQERRKEEGLHHLQRQQRQQRRPREEEEVPRERDGRGRRSGDNINVNLFRRHFPLFTS